MSKSLHQHPQVVRQLQDTALRYFLEVARCGSISKASQRLNVAGSSISRHIAQLEDLLGAPLFDRRPRGMVPSAAGEVLAVHAQKTAHDAERAVFEIQGLKGMRQGRVKLGVTEGFAMEFIPRLIADFSREHPGVQFEIVVDAPAEAARRVLQGDVDISIALSRTVDKDLKIEYSQPSPVMAVMRRSHPLAHSAQIKLAQLLPYPIALPGLDTTVRQLVDIVCNRQRLTIQPVLTSNYLASLFGFLQHHPDSVTLSGEFSIRDHVARGELACVRLRDKGLDLRDIVVQTLMGRTLSHAAQAFLSYLKLHLARRPKIEAGGK